MWPKVCGPPILKSQGFIWNQPFFAAGNVSAYVGICADSVKLAFASSGADVGPGSFFSIDVPFHPKGVPRG